MVLKKFYLNLLPERINWSVSVESPHISQTSKNIKNAVLGDRPIVEQGCVPANSPALLRAMRIREIPVVDRDGVVRFEHVFEWAEALSNSNLNPKGQAEAVLKYPRSDVIFSGDSKGGAKIQLKGFFEKSKTKNEFNIADENEKFLQLEGNGNIADSQDVLPAEQFVEDEGSIPLEKISNNLVGIYSLRNIFQNLDWNSIRISCIACIVYQAGFAAVFVGSVVVRCVICIRYVEVDPNISDKKVCTTCNTFATISLTCLIGSVTNSVLDWFFKILFSGLIFFSKKVLVLFVGVFVKSEFLPLTLNSYPSQFSQILVFYKNSILVAQSVAGLFLMALLFVSKIYVFMNVQSCVNNHAFNNACYFIYPQLRKVIKIKKKIKKK